MRTRYDAVGVCLKGPKNATVGQVTEMPTIYFLSKDKATIILQRKEQRRIKKELKAVALLQRNKFSYPSKCL